MPADDSSLYGIKRQRNLTGGTEISSSTSLAFTSTLSSLINSSSSASASRQSGARTRLKKNKDDIFTTHNRNTSKRAALDLAPDTRGVFSVAPQQHTTQGSALDAADFARSRRKLEDKARLYAAMRRGELDDADERYAVDFDRKWAEARAARGSRSPSPSSSSSSSSHSSAASTSRKPGADRGQREQVEYLDEFGRTRTGSRLDAARAAHQQRLHAAASSFSAAADDDRASALPHDDSITARPSAPATLLRGDAIQHAAFNPDGAAAARMAALAAKRDRSLTPPPHEHFDGGAEARARGTGFFAFSRDEAERGAQMAALAAQRAETERVRAERRDGGGGGGGAVQSERRRERDERLAERRRMLDERRARGVKRKADEFLSELGARMVAEQSKDDVDGGNSRQQED